MKKILLSSLLSVLVISSAFAQIRWQTNTVIGQELKATNLLNKDTLILDFKNVLDINSFSKWFKCKASANLGKDSLVKKTLQTQRGIQVKGFLNKSTTTAYEDGTFKCNNAGSNGNPGRVYSLDSLKSYLAKSIINTNINFNTSDSLSRPAACLFNVGTSEIAFGMYPGKVKVIEYLYRFDYSSKACTDDITFDIDTYDVGNTGKTATYQLAVYKSSVSTANLIADTVDVYTTGQGLKTVHVAQEIGVSPSDLSNKSLYIVIRTLGTSNAMGVVDGLPNPVDVNNVPTLTDPIIIFDNFFLTYASASWDYPVGAVASSVYNHNDGSPILTTSTDYSGGTPTNVLPDISSPVYFYITSKDRIGTLDITEGNDGGGHSSAFSFAPTGSVMRKAPDGSFSIPVSYTYTPSPDGIIKMDLLIPAPTSGSINDTLQVAVLANVPLGATRAVRLEITNGVRFWYNVSAIGEVATANNTIDLDKAIIYANKETIYVSNTEENVNVFTISGQKVKSVSANEAAQGIKVNSGLYIVKTGSTVQKVLVK